MALLSLSSGIWQSPDVAQKSSTQLAAGTGGPRQPLSHRHTSGLYFAYLNQQMFCYFSLKKYKNVLISCCFSQSSACKFNKKPVSGSRVQLDEISGSRSAGEAKTRAKAFLDVEHRSCFLSCKREEPLSGRGFHITSLSVIVALWLRVIFKTEAVCISQRALLGVFIEFLMAVLWICKKLWFHDPGGFWVLQYLETFSNRQHSDSFLLHFPSISFTLFFFPEVEFDCLPFLSKCEGLADRLIFFFLYSSFLICCFIFEKIFTYFDSFVRLLSPAVSVSVITLSAKYLWMLNHTRFLKTSASSLCWHSNIVILTSWYTCSIVVAHNKSQRKPNYLSVTALKMPA